MTNDVQEKTVKKTFWAVAFFYIIIAFEFFYMASPFAIYFYSAYRPGLNFFGNNPKLAWMVQFFLPHIVNETQSTLINLHNIIGSVLAAGGFLIFSICAAQVYYFKLAKKGTVSGGIYRYVRHPQYMGLAICGFGLLLLWPRNIMIPMYITMLFVYYLLGRIEEKECTVKFGKSYEDYMKQTGMFLPFKMPSVVFLPASRTARAAVLIGIYALTVITALGAAKVVEYLSIRSLYGYYTEDSATVSLVKMDSTDLKKMIEVATADGRTRERLVMGGDDLPVKYLNYVLPADWSVSELPMNPIEESETIHFLLSDYRGSLYRIIITRAVLRDGNTADGRDIVSSAVRTIPLVEVLIDTQDGTVVGIEDPVTKGQYGNMPMPVF